MTPGGTASFSVVSVFLGTRAPPEKPQNPYPLLLRRILRRILPPQTYRRYIGRHEDASMRLWARLAVRVPPSSAILDIGAFHGKYALSAKNANPAVAVYAFEPNLQTAKVLRLACENTGVKAREIAVAEETGTLPFLYNGDRSRLVTRVFAPHLGERVHEVTAVTLDSWTGENGVAPSLIKIDVEGAEAGILRSAGRVLKAHGPALLCEVLTDAAGEEVMAALPSRYCFYEIDENFGPRERRRITRRLWRNKNWLLIPEERKSDVGM